ncbi:MAG: L-fucose/L-arabinose isomerase family protein [Bacillota bacterium]
MTTLGVVVGNRGFFPGELCVEGRNTILEVLKEENFNVVTLSCDQTSYGSVENFDDVRKCVALFKEHSEEIDGIVVTLPNFGDERAVADTIRYSGLNVPVLVHAYPDDVVHMDVANRRDSFCGKMSVCNNLRQYGIPFSLTRLHTVDPRSESFREDLRKFGAVCRVVKGLRGARFGQIGTRPANFKTVRYSEKLLEHFGISVDTIDLSEILGRIRKLRDDDESVLGSLNELKRYTRTDNVPAESLLKMAKLAVALSQVSAEREWSGTAIQCWTSMQENYGVVPCAVMSMAGNLLRCSACEADIAGLVGMYALVLASGRPSALVDWNNNFGDDPDKGVVFHCSNFPQALFGGNGVMDYQAIIAGTVGKEKAQGTLVGNIVPTPVTYCRVSTDDCHGVVRAYVGEAEITGDKVSTFGGYGVIRVPGFQDLLRYICEHGFEHHVALNPSQVASAIAEAFGKYLGWDVYLHQGA